jgi:hypothetical protein
MNDTVKATTNIIANCSQAALKNRPVTPTTIANASEARRVSARVESLSNDDYVWSETKKKQESARRYLSNLLLKPYWGFDI